MPEMQKNKPTDQYIALFFSDMIMLFLQQQFLVSWQFLVINISGHSAEIIRLYFGTQALHCAEWPHHCNSLVTGNLQGLDFLSGKLLIGPSKVPAFFTKEDLAAGSGLQLVFCHNQQQEETLFWSVLLATWSSNASVLPDPNLLQNVTVLRFPVSSQAC